MSLHKPKLSPYYHFSFTIKGARFHGSTGCTSKAKALAVERRNRDEAISGRDKRTPITVNEACGLYQTKVERMPSWPTMRYMMQALVKGLGQNRRLSDVMPVDLQRYFSGRSAERSSATVNREIENARAVWRYAEKSRFDIGEMPDWRSLKLKESRRPPRELGDDEELRLFSNLRADIRDAVDFLLKSGWRRNEVLHLKWSDCDLSKRSATTKIKGGDVVARPLTNTLCAIIERQPKVGPFVFTYQCQRSLGLRRKGQRYHLTPTALRSPFANALKDAGINRFRTHDLRHTCGTRIVRATGSLAAAKGALKHSSINTTLRYAHVLDEDVRNALEATESRNSDGANASNDAKR